MMYNMSELYTMFEMTCAMSEMLYGTYEMTYGASAMIYNIFEMTSDMPVMKHGKSATTYDKSFSHDIWHTVFAMT